MKNIKYPKYTKKQDGRCKLTENNIKNIRNLFKSGVSRKNLAKQFKVSITAIQYWTNEEYRQHIIKTANKRTKELYKKNPELRVIVDKKYQLKKIKLQGSEYFKFKQQQHNLLQPRTLILKTRLKELLEIERICNKHK